MIHVANKLNYISKRKIQILVPERDREVCVCGYGQKI